MTFTSLPPKRRDVRQQSIAVLPTPMMSTRSPIFSMWPKCADAEPLDADVDVRRRLRARPGMSRFLPVGAPLPTNTASKPSASSAFMLVDRRVVPDVDAHVEDVADLFVEHLRGQAERRNVDAHQPARLGELLEDHDVVAERHEVVRDGERRRARADERDALAVLHGRRFREELGDVVAMVGGDALQPADRDRLSVDASAAARGLAGAVAGAAEDAREDVRFAVEEVRLGVSPLRDEPDVLGDVGVGRAGPLAVHHFMVVLRIGNIRRRPGRTRRAGCCGHSRGSSRQGRGVFHMIKRGERRGKVL